MPHTSVTFETTLFPGDGNTTVTVDGHCFPVRGILDIREEVQVGNNTAPISTVTNEPLVVCLSVFTSDIHHFLVLECPFYFSGEADVVVVVSLPHFYWLSQKNIRVETRIIIIMVVTPALRRRCD